MRVGAGPTVYLRDLATIQDSTDIIVGYAHVNGKRTVYIPVTKRRMRQLSAVIQSARQALPTMRNVVPEDVKIDLVFDQSGYVVNAIKGLTKEGLLGAFLTGLMVVLFLRDWRSALIVVTTIPFAILAAVVSLWAAGQTINIMTLGGLALAVGVLVDEATVAIESIHTHLDFGLPRARAVIEACRKNRRPATAGDALCFVGLPAVVLYVGVGQQLFVPLSLAVGFAMVWSYLLSSTLVPVLSTWLMRHKHAESESRSLFEKLQSAYGAYLTLVVRFRWPVVGLYILTTRVLLVLVCPSSWNRVLSAG